MYRAVDAATAATAAGAATENVPLVWQLILHFRPTIHVT